jgi:hypothetical protein
VLSWLPRAVILPTDRGEAVLAVGDPGDTRPIEEQGLRRSRPGRFAGPAGDGGVLMLSEGAGARWRAASGARTLERLPIDDVHAWRVEPDDVRVVLTLQGGLLHALVVAAQLLVVLAIASLALRPPGTRQRRVAAATLPSALTAGPDLIPPGGVIVPSAMAGQRGPAPHDAPPSAEDPG